MKRDFSDAALQTLLGLVEEVEDRQWCGATDWLGDRWSGLRKWTGFLDIDKYADNVDAYHEEMIDKNNATKESIQQIFEDVRQADTAYGSIAGNLLDSVRTQKEYIEKLAAAIDPSQPNFTIEGIQGLLEGPAEKLKKEIVEAHADRLRKGTGDDSYDYDYLREKMEKDPNDLSPEEYAALITVFNEMESADKERFIETSYFVGDFYTSTNAGSTIEGKWEYNISPVIQGMVEIYEEGLDGKYSAEDLAKHPDSNANKNLFDYNLLKQISTYGQKIYVNGATVGPIKTKHPVDISITKYQKDGVYWLPWDYEVKYNGSETPYDSDGMMNFHDAGFKLFQYRKDLDAVLDENIKETTSSMRTTNDQILGNAVIDGTITLISVVPGFGETMAVVSGVRIVNSAVSGSIEVDETNGKMDSIDRQLDEGNASRALKYGAVVTTYPDGTYSRSAVYVNKEELSALLEDYREQGYSAGFNADDVERTLQNGGSIYSLDGAKEFIEWSTSGNGG